MPKNFTITEFRRTYPTEASCLRALFEEKQGVISVCPKCQRKTKFYRLKRRKAYSCEWCRHKIDVLAGTIFHKSRTPLKSWFYILYLFANSKNGVSAMEIQRQLGVTYNCAYRMGKQIRTLFIENHKEKLKGVVEADESWFGHIGHKVPVAGLVERGGRIITKVVDDVSAKTLIPYIERNVAIGAAIMTDEHRPYRILRRRGYEHETVNHSRWQWKNGRASTNTLESHWGLMKRSIRGTYSAISAQHAQMYVSEFEWRRNHRHADAFPQLLVEASRPLRVTS